MVVQHNLQAINANRMLSVTSSGQAKATEKLSSGYKINRAADDAAGLGISEKMRKQMRGLDRASTNAQDGVSAVQTAEGALNEVHDMLQRMNELAVQAANGTNSLSDRESIQDEINELLTEIDRVSETTKFNETELLKGALGTKTRYLKGHDAGINGTFVDGVQKATLTVTLSVGTEIVIAGQKYNIINKDSLSAKEAEMTAIKNGSPTGPDSVEYLQTQVPSTNGGSMTINGTSYNRIDGKWTAGSGNEYTDGQMQEMIKEGTIVSIGGGSAVHARDYSQKNNISRGEAAYLISISLKQANDVGIDPETPSNVHTTATGTTSFTRADAISTDKVEFHIKKGRVQVPNVLSFDLHVGADADMGNKIILEMDGMTTAGLGIKNLQVSDDSGIAATYAIDAIGDGLQRLSEQRSKLGAIQNRLEHTISNLDNVVENTTAAESRIRDTDMAEEMVEYSKNNILQQAGQSMLAQANQSTQGVLSLLNG